MKVYIVLDDSRACYDAGGIFVEAFQTREEAESYLGKFGRYDQGYFYIEEVEI